MTYEEAIALQFGPRPRIRQGASNLFARRTWYIDCPRCGFVYRTELSALKDAIKDGRHNGVCPDCLKILVP